MWRARAGRSRGSSTAPGFAEAYRQFVAGGWPALGGPPEFGGQPVPRVLVTAVSEFWGSANLAFKLGPMLTQGAAHALELCGSPAQKALYLPKLVSGEWTGTMVLTEPQAGSDLGQVRTRAALEGDHYRLSGRRSSSPGATMTSPPTRSTCCSDASTARPPGSRASRCSSCRSTWSTRTARSARVTRCAACRSSTSSGSTRAPPAYWRSASTMAQSRT